MRSTSSPSCSLERRLTSPGPSDRSRHDFPEENHDNDFGEASIVPDAVLRALRTQLAEMSTVANTLKAELDQVKEENTTLRDTYRTEVAQRAKSYDGLNPTAWLRELAACLGRGDIPIGDDYDVQIDLYHKINASVTRNLTELTKKKRIEDEIKRRKRAQEELIKAEDRLVQSRKRRIEALEKERQDELEVKRLKCLVGGHPVCNGA